MYQNRYTNIGIIFLFQSKNKENSALLYCQGYMNSQKKNLPPAESIFLCLPLTFVPCFIGGVFVIEKKKCVWSDAVYLVSFYSFSHLKNTLPPCFGHCHARTAGEGFSIVAKRRKGKARGNGANPVLSSCPTGFVPV